MLQYSIRTLLVSMLAITVCIVGWQWYQRRVERDEIEALTLGHDHMLEASKNAPTYERSQGFHAYYAKVDQVVDGDTILVLTEYNAEVLVRLRLIDAPEKHQPYFAEAKQFLSDQILGKRVWIKKPRADASGQTVATVIGEKQDLSEAMVKNGLAWLYTRITRGLNSDAVEIARLERAARAQQKNIWSQEDPIPPWQWRYKKW